MDPTNGRLELSEDEAFALLGLAMTASMTLDKTSERAVRKLAEYCKRKQTSHYSSAQDCELIGAG